MIGVMANLMCQWEWTNRAPIQLSKGDSGCVCGLFLDEANIGIGRLSKASTLPGAGGPHPIS